MNSKNDNKIFAVMLIAIASLTALCLILALTLAILSLALRDDNKTPRETDGEQTTETVDQPTSTTPGEVLLKESADAGEGYIGQMIFIGESTTAHLSSRDGLYITPEQVWKDSSGTKRLSSRITSEKIIYKKTGETLTVAEACALEQPKYVVLSFGLNGIMDFINNKNSYVNNYGKLIGAIQAASPDTRIILQTVYPVSNADDFSVDVATLNAHIDTLNSWLPEIAAAHKNVRVADTASVLRNVDGQLGSAYDVGDGIHLNANAYLDVLAYLRTHAWQ